MGDFGGAFGLLVASRQRECGARLPGLVPSATLIVLVAEKP